MKSETGHKNWLLRGTYTLIALVIPILSGYIIYDQVQSPVIDMFLDWRTGVIQEVPTDSFADWNGFQVGDIILSIEGTPLPEWQKIEKQNYQVKIQRGGEILDMELPVASILMINPWPLVSALTIALMYWGLSLILLVRQFQQKEVRLLFLPGQTLAITLLFPVAYSGFYSHQWCIDLSVVCLHLSAPLILHFYLIFPVTLGTNHQRNWILKTVYGLALVVSIIWFFRMDFALRWDIVYTASVFATAIGAVIYAYLRRAAPEERRRLRIIVLSTLFASIPALLFYLLPTLISSPQRMPIWMVGLFTIIAPIGYFYAIVRHNLFGIDRLLNRTLVYAILSVGILLLYLGPFLLIYHFAPGDILAQAMIAAGLTLLVGLAFERTRTLVQHIMDRIFYGGWYDYPGVVETISNALSRSTQREQLKDVLTHQVSDLMQLHPGKLWIGCPGETPPVNINRSHTQFSFDLQRQYQGIWTIAERLDGDDLSDADQRILTTLAHQAEVALNNVLLIETLQRQLDEIRKAQRQLLRSREEERARLARELHDGPIQALVALNLQLGLQLAEKYLPDSSLLDAKENNSSLNQALDEMRVEVKGLLNELRQVCAELRPPMLDTLGLGAAIQALTDDWSSQSNIPVQLDLSADVNLRTLPEEVSVNLYRITQEALTNVARHTQAQKVIVSLTWKAACLQLYIQDDGQGFTPPFAPNKLTAQGHFGLVGIQERVNLIGGQLKLQSAPGEGAKVSVVWHPQDASQNFSA